MKCRMVSFAVFASLFLVSCDDYTAIFDPPPSGHHSVIIRITGVSNDELKIINLFDELENLPGGATGTPLYEITKYKVSDTWFFKLSRTNDYHVISADKLLVESVIGILSGHDLTKVNTTIYTINSDIPY